ncbi:hypothetical protein MPER_14722, partial [Moniliophthora perniciosa FA553]
MSIVTIVQSTRPNSSFWASDAVRFSLAYYALTMSFTIISTSFIIGRLYMFRRRYQKLLGATSGLISFGLAY